MGGVLTAVGGVMLVHWSTLSYVAYVNSVFREIQWDVRISLPESCEQIIVGGALAVVGGALPADSFLQPPFRGFKGS